MQEPYIVEKSEFKAIGIKLQTSFTKESTPTTAKIGGHWQRFFAEKITNKIPKPLNENNILSCYTDYESDYKGNYSLILGLEVDSTELVPPGLVDLVIPAQKYLVFTAAGQMPQAIIEAWIYIWNYFVPGCKYKRSYTTDFEIHNRKDQSSIDIYIAIK